MKLSIIVPVYNVEQYIRKCILSIINQDNDLFKSIELIIVNDGTKDKSIQKIQDLIDTYDNISLINQDNLSLSVARNNGMIHAKGDYVWFVDSDDWISRDALKVLLPYLDNVNDIISFGYRKVTETGETLCSIFFEEVKTFNGKDTFRHNCEFSTMAQRAVYRKGFLNINKLAFMPGVYNQDDELCLRASYLAEKVTLLPVSIYYFLRTTGEKHKSIMNNASPKYGFDYITVSKSLYNFCNEKVKESDLYTKFQKHISVLLNCGITSIGKCSESDQRKFVELYNNSPELNKCYLASGGKYFIEGVLFALFPKHILLIFKMLKVLKS